MEKNYYISGYTGFCPDMAHRIGQNYTESTRDALLEQPHLRGRLGDVGWHDLQQGGSMYRNGGDFECAYDAMPEYTTGYTGHIPTNLWTSCKRDDQRYSNSRCPLKAYPLSCSEYGSPCLDNGCRDYSMCSGQGYGYDNNMYQNMPHGDFHRNEYYKDSKSSKSCCSSCSKGGQCESERRSQHSAPQKQTKACCNSCAQGGACESDRRSQHHATNQSSRASFSSCSSNGSRENSRRAEASCCRFKFRDVEERPYRKCGVIPNYMGYIPGLQMTFGEPYGITANRLLQRHFNEQENRHF